VASESELEFRSRQPRTLAKRLTHGRTLRLLRLEALHMPSRKQLEKAQSTRTSSGIATDVRVVQAQDDALRQALGESGDYALLSRMDATVSHGTVRRDHGIAIELTAQTNSGYYTSKRVLQAKLDVHGGIFAALPNGLGSMAQMLLPLAARIDVEKRSEPEQKWAGTLVLGAKKLSRGRLESTLADIVAAGDPPFCFEIRTSEDRLLGFFPTRASLLQHGLSAPGTSVRDVEIAGNVFRKSRLRKCVEWLRWWLLPLIFLAASWHLFLQPQQVLAHIPLLPMFGADTARSLGPASVASVLPPHPKTMAEAFQLGQIHSQLHQLQLLDAHGSRGTSAPAAPGVEELLAKAGHVLDADGEIQVSWEQLESMLEEILRFESQVGVVYRVLGFFTFVNTVWLCAIIGIAVSIGPSIYHILQPLHDALRRLVKWIYTEIILPNILRMHRWGVLEALAWLGCWFGLCQGVKIGAIDVGEMVSLTASALAAPALGYTTLLRGKRTSPEVLGTVVPLFFVVACFPWALHYQSQLYGYITTVAAYNALGFGVAHHRLCWCIGFNSEQAMHRVCASSLCLVSMFLSLKLSGAANNSLLLTPFGSATSVFGTIMLFLSLLIISSKHYDYGESARWWYSNGLMLTLLVLLNAVGHTFGLVGMANTATTFGVLWTMEKYGEFHLENRWNGWVLLLMFSVVAWRGSLYLHAHPDYIVSMFSMS